MAYEAIIYDKQGGIACITLNRPARLNALNRQICLELEHALEQTAVDDSARVVLLTGGNKVFCAGADLTEVSTSTSTDAYAFSRRMQLLMQRFEDFPKPIIAAVSGFALGGGCELCLVCDLRIASETARFGVPEVNLGAFPAAGGTQRLPRIVGMTMAAEMLLTGDPIDAAEALRIGLVNRVVPQEQLLEEAQTLAARLATKPPLALGAIRSLIRSGYEMPLGGALDYESRTFASLAATGDFKEALEAYRERRTPRFVGR